MHDPGPSILTLLAGGSLLLVAGQRLRGPAWAWAAATLATLIASAALFATAPTADTPRNSEALLFHVIVGRLSESAMWLTLAAGALLALSEAWARETRRDGSTFGLLLLACAGVLTTAAAATAWEVWAGLELTAVAGAVSLRETRLPTAEDPIAREWVIGLGAALLVLAGLAMADPAAVPAGAPGPAVAVSSEAGAPLPARPSRAAAISAALLASGLGLRLMAVPFHLGRWKSGGQFPLQQIARSLTLVRAAALIAWARLLTFGPGPGSVSAVMTGVLAAASLVVGGILLRSETQARRSVQAIVILQNGMTLTGLAAAAWISSVSEARPAGGMVSLIAGAGWISFWAETFATLGWCLVLAGAHAAGRPLEFLEDLRGLGRTRPVAAVLASVFLVALGGWPASPVFWSRILCIAAAWGVRHETLSEGVPRLHPGFLLLLILVLAGWGVLAWFSLRMLDSLWLRGPLGLHESIGRRGMLLPALALAVACVVAGFLPGTFLDWMTPSNLVRPTTAPAPGAPAGRSRQRASLPTGRFPFVAGHSIDLESTRSSLRLRAAGDLLCRAETA